MTACCRIVTVLLLAPSSALADAPGSRWSPGEHRAELRVESAGVLRYAVLMPELEADERAPLILALHYGGPVTPHLGLRFAKGLIAPAFEELNAVIVAPDCPGRGWKDPMSERAVLELLDKLLAELPVDPERVVITGYSMGGIGAWFLAGRHPERFSAIVPAAGIPVEGLEVPVFAVHSKADEIIDYRPTEKAVKALREAERKAELLLLEDLTHYQTAAYAKPMSRAVPWLRDIWSKE